MRTATHWFLLCLVSMYMAGCNHATKSLSQAPPVDPRGVPTTDSVKEFMRVMHFEELIAGLMEKVTVSVRTSMATIQTNQFNAEQDRLFNEFKTKAIEVIGYEYGWARFEPRLVIVTQASYSQQDIDALIAFYRSEVGAAIVRQLPEVMQSFSAAIFDEWLRLFKTQGREAAAERMKQDIGTSFRPSEVQEFVNFFASDIGRDIEQNQAEWRRQYDLQLGEIKDDAKKRLQELAADYMRRTKDAATAK
jgi:hypothetical protein